jgi:hypothetical protein
VFSSLSDFDSTKPPLRFTTDPEVGLVVAASDVLHMVRAIQSVMAHQAIGMIDGEPDPIRQDAITRAGLMGCEAIDIVLNQAEGLFLEASFHSGTATDPRDSDDGKPPVGFA